MTNEVVWCNGDDCPAYAKLVDGVKERDAEITALRAKLAEAAEGHELLVDFVERWAVYKRFKAHAPEHRITAEMAISIIAYHPTIYARTVKMFGNGEIDEAVYAEELRRAAALLASLDIKPTGDPL